MTTSAPRRCEEFLAILCQNGINRNAVVVLFDCGLDHLIEVCLRGSDKWGERLACKIAPLDVDVKRCFTAGLEEVHANLVDALRQFNGVRFGLRGVNAIVVDNRSAVNGQAATVVAG